MGTTKPQLGSVRSRIQRRPTLDRGATPYREDVARQNLILCKLTILIFFMMLSDAHPRPQTKGPWRKPSRNCEERIRQDAVCNRSKT
jgi:hypothetical protein